MLYPTHQHRPFHPAPLSLLLLLALVAALAGGIAATPGRDLLNPPGELGQAFFAEGLARPALPPPAGTTSIGAMLAPDPQTGGLRLLGQTVAGDLRVITDRPLTVAGDLRAGGALELRAPRLSISASLTATSIDLRAAGLLDLSAGQTITARAGGDGGQIRLAGDALVLAGALDAGGAAGGAIALSGRQIIQAGPASALSTAGAGGAISILATAGYVGTAAASLDLRGARAGGHLRVDAGAGRLFSSAPMWAGGQIGGGILLLGHDIALMGADLDASGATAGGEVRIGRTTWAEARAGQLAATMVTISPSTQIRADAIGGGDGGRILVWSDGETVADGSLSARGGARSGNGGTLEISGRVSLAGRAEVRVDAPAGRAGLVRFDPKNLIISSTAGFPQYDLLNPTIETGDLFGYIDDDTGVVEGTVIPLGNGNMLILDSGDDAVATNAGAAYIFNVTTGALISTLTGSKADDHVGSLDVAGSTPGALSLGNGNYVLRSPLWDNGAATDAGAVTWFSGTNGVSGVVSSSNSLVGSTSGDKVGNITANGVVALSSGNYVVRSPSWNNAAIAGAGATTWGNGTLGVTGTVTITNSLVGTHADDNVGSDMTLLRNGSYVILSPKWDSTLTDVGAATWGSGAGGLVGLVSAANSLVGSHASDLVGSDGAVALTNGNYVVRSSSWDNGLVTDAGAVTWGSGVGGVKGAVADGNSLVGTTASDQVGLDGVVVLANGNYVTITPKWDKGGISNAGAVTWGNGMIGTPGPISSVNSIIGAAAVDSVGSGGIVELSNGNYVVLSPLWNNGPIFSDAGAVTWARGAAATGLTVSASNSLVGNLTGDTASSTVTALSNGNYVVRSPYWDRGFELVDINVGAVTWGNGAVGMTGAITMTNSLVGSSPNDNIGLDGALALSNGNYVVASSLWDNGATADVGAATWCSGASGRTGTVTVTNSLVGSTASDLVGSDGVVALVNGNYVVRSSSWNNGAATSAGAATWGSGASGVTGKVSASNSLVGAHSDDLVGTDNVVALPNGNYVVISSDWNNGATASAGAATWGSGASGVAGAVSASNSLVGTHAFDQVGVDGVFTLSSGNYVVLSSGWGNGTVTAAGAATWGSGASGVSGEVSASNSLVGTHIDDQVGLAIRQLSGNSYLVVSSSWDSETITDAGAVTLSNGATGISGAVTTQNSVAGRQSLSSADAPAAQTTDGSFYVHFASHDRVAVGLPDLHPLFTFARGQTSNVGLRTDSLTSILASGAALTLQANNDITFSSAITVTNPSGIGGAITVQAGRSLIINASITSDGAPLTLIANERLASGVIDIQRDDGAGSITMVDGAVINAGTANVTVDLRNGAGKTNTLYGGVTLGRVTGNLRILAGTLTPGGDEVGTTVVTGSLSLGSGLNTSIDGPEAGQADQVEVKGPVALAGVLLISVSSSYVPKIGETFVLISNDQSDAVSGTFSGLPEGSAYIVGGMPMILSYKGGDGNDVVLIVSDNSVYLPLLRR